MGVRIYSNVSALTALRHLDRSTERLSTSIERLSSGLRINRAGDDPAGLAISEKLRNQVLGLRRATLNAQDGTSLLQTAEGALSEVHTILQRMRELAVQAANDTLTQADRIEIQREIDQLKEEVNRISATTEFNEKNLLDGSATALASSDDAKNVRVVIRDVVQEGNYKITKQNSPGHAQVLKSATFNLVANSKNPNGTRGRATDFGTSSIFQGVGESLKSGNLTGFTNLEFSSSIGGTNNQLRDFRLSVIPVSAASTDQVAIADHYFSASGGKSGFLLTNNNTAGPGDSGYYEVEVTSVYGNDGVIETALGSERLYELTVREIDAKGSVIRSTSVNLSHTQASAATDVLGTGYAEMVTGGATAITMGGDQAKWSVGDKFIVVINANEDFPGVAHYVQQLHQDTGDNGFQVDTVGSGVRNDAAEDRVGLYTSLGTDVTAIDGSSFATSLLYYDASGNRQLGTGTVQYGENGYSVNASGGSVDFYLEETTLAERTTRLADVDAFAGLFSQGGQVLDIYNGRGDHTSLVLNASDTMETVAAKIRDAIIRSTVQGGLGMGVDGNLSRLTGVDGNVCVFVSEPAENTDEAVPSTFIIRSTVPGAEGRLVFSGAQQILDAFSLAQITDPDDPMQVTVTDAHTGALVGTATVDDGVVRNLIQGVDLFIDQRLDTLVRFVPGGEVLTPGDLMEGGAENPPGTASDPRDIIAGNSTFAANMLQNFKGLEADPGSVGSPVNNIANFELRTNDATSDQFCVADYQFVTAAAKAGFTLPTGAGLSISANTTAGYYELQVVAINGVTTAGTSSTLTAVDAAANGMDLRLTKYDRNGTMLEQATVRVGNTAAGISVANVARAYFGETFAGGTGLASTGIDAADSASINLGLGTTTYAVGDRITFAVADTAGHVTANLRNDTSDTGFAGPYGLNQDAGVSTLAQQSAAVRVGLIEDLGANNFSNVAGQKADVTLGYYDAGGNFTVGGGSVILGQPGDTIQAGTLRFTTTVESAAGPGFAFESAPGASISYVHLVDNRISLQVGANEGQTMTAAISQLDTTALGLDSVLVISRQFAQEALAKVDAAVNIVSSQRAKLGALINRLEATRSVLQIQAENLLNSESRIRDLDIASETVDFTRDQILSQAGTAMLAQANAIPQSVLQLLQ
ncbi:MAG TPA: flagellin [Armatimonadota bacterium]|nr:flagellin [Armatimonadota bacterium]